MELEQPIPSFSDDATDDQGPSKNHSSGAAAAPPPLPTTCFDCSICLDFAVDPVVTLCGHLYCWPCIYKWLQVKTAAPHQCPVCKAPLSLNALVPLYGRGSVTAHTDKASRYGSVNIPNRPSVLRNTIASAIDDHHLSGSPNDEYAGLHLPAQRQTLHHHHHHHHYYYPSPWTTSVFNSTLGGLALAILPWVTRNRDDTGSMQFSRLHHFVADGYSIRERRQELQMESWLHQIWVFLSCCVVLCLLLF